MKHLKERVLDDNFSIRETLLESCVNAVDLALQGWEGRDVSVKCDWLDGETFVVNFRRGDMPSELAEEYANCMLGNIGCHCAEILNEYISSCETERKGEWVCHSELNHYNDEIGDLGNCDDDVEWDTMQAYIYFQIKTGE